MVLLIIGCIGLNNLGGHFVEDLGVPLYLDMIGTAIAAIALGPWYGVGVGLSSNLLGSAFEGSMQTTWFALVNGAGALIWGYGVRGWFGRSRLRFFALNLVVAVVCSLIAVPILVLVFGGSTGHTGQDALNAVLAALSTGLWAAVFSSNLLISAVDKLVSGYLGIFTVWLLAKFGEQPFTFGQTWLTTSFPIGEPVSGFVRELSQPQSRQTPEP